MGNAVKTSEVELPDWVSEKIFGGLIGKTKRALETMRQRKLIPEGEVWKRTPAGIMFSRSGWDKWVDSQHSSQSGYRSTVTRSSSDLHGTANAAAKSTRRRIRKPISNEPVIYVVK